MSLTRIPSRLVATCLPVLAAAVLLAVTPVRPAMGASLDVPPPTTSTNAAVHYHRAILFLLAVDPRERLLLEKPIWEIVTTESTADDLAVVDKTLVASRHAIRAALVGAEQTDADFGLDVRQYLLATYLPHCHPMTDLGKLLALHGLQRQSAGDWKSAAEIYLAGFRMGRHLCHQTTLAETLAGVEVLETTYFAFGHWAARCPDTELIADALNLVNVMSLDMVNPARIMRFEATISKLRLDAVRDAFPDGAWAEMVLEALGEEPPAGDAAAMRQAAIDAAAEHGVPREAFDDKESFERYLRKLRSVYMSLARESANCLTFAPPESIHCAAKLFAKYEPELLPTERTSTLNPAKLAAYFAVHQAELDMLRLVLAVSAARTDEGFPRDLESVRHRVGGSLPTSPFDGSAYVYEAVEGGKGFSLQLAAARVGDIELPGIRFQHIDR